MADIQLDFWGCSVQGGALSAKYISHLLNIDINSSKFGKVGTTYIFYISSFINKTGLAKIIKVMLSNL